MKPIADPLFSEASAPPQVSRMLLHYAMERGVNAQWLCRGLGFAPDDLKKPGYLLSHRQSNLLVRRTITVLGDDGLGLSVGERQTAVSWGIVGLGMQASPTLGDALDLAIRYQKHTGALLCHRMEFHEDRCLTYLVPQFFDPDVISFYLEEAFASAMAIARHLSGRHDLVPSRVELEYPEPPHGQRYTEIFRCPVVFAGAHNLIEFDARWLEIPLSTRDDFVAAEVAELLDSANWEDKGTSDLVETVHREIRKQLCAPPSLNDLAQQLNIGERTLRRRLEAAGQSYQGVIDSLRRAKALSLLSHRETKLIDVATETGFSDIRDFRRAFKRWTGVTPRQARCEIQQFRKDIQRPSPS
ncbi:AraC family transcriptional regulator [Pseudomonas caricapapayae]|uniref:AraC family transcriptional regulator n=1 Tax=Pseudomonas caricapapayae TaxID=46678 RepID=A0A0P9K774_9PSED|nr:AraC family transcriptional regulator [Pseudomonas caricapapayae]KAA8697981.1 AraC family transcriptional regulator [Pseudomonas caricapapayae]KPW60276.1 AraC family transcriptional regulator [Pseudomonas caricapapayae]RMM09763.1 AraC family transcriptional regulator [Pseudomonas caricapapayae]RMV79622.1 AraC family transcriptional regulator [Pseudomonas caricapapayae]RMV95078.1 AraC family transcriptional regulator [Pseudomonas caricapapayae]